VREKARALMHRLVRAAVAVSLVGLLAACSREQPRPQPSNVVRPAAPTPVPCPSAGAASRVCRPDVLVVGGGLSGIAAAVAAARHGLHATLLAPEPYLGGIVTAAMMDQWDFNVVAGQRSVQHGQFDEMYAQLGDSFTPDTAKRVLAAYAARAGVVVLNSTHVERVAGAAAPGGRRIAALVARDARGTLRRFDAPCFVDATDAADVAALAGARYGIGRQDKGHDSKMQAATLIFRIDGIDWSRVLATYTMSRYGYGRAIGARAWGYSTIARAYRPHSPRVTVRDLNLVRHPDGSVTVNSINVFDVDGRSPQSVADGVAIAKAEAPALVAFLRPRIDGFEQARAGGFADALYVRETRHVRGVVTLGESDVWNRRVPFDTIGLASYPLDTHPVEPSDKQTYAPERRVYGVPLGALLPRGFVNLGLASPSISATHVAAGSARIIPMTVEEGEALGTACALARARGRTLLDVDRDPALVRALRADLQAHGVLLVPPAPALSSADRVGA
jgi:FAD dependent oxidoreductase